MWRSRYWAATVVVLLAIVGVWVWTHFPGPDAVAPPPAQAPPPDLAAALNAIQQNDLQTGARLLDAIIADNPRHPEALLYRGQIKRNGGDLEGAIRDWSAV